MNRLKWFIETALSYLGTPYKWGGDDPSGFDCSGLVGECLRSVGLLSETPDLTADALYQHFKGYEVHQPLSGALMFRLNDKGRAYHVEICLDSDFRLGASGGDSKTVSLDDAWRDNAFIKIRPIGSRNVRKVFVYPFMEVQ